MSTLSANCRAGLEFLENALPWSKAEHPLGVILAVGPKVKATRPNRPLMV